MGGREALVEGFLVDEQDEWCTGRVTCLGSQEGKKMWSKFCKVFCSLITITNPRTQKQALMHRICTNSHWPQALTAKKCTPWPDRHATILLPGLENAASFFQ